MDKYDVKKGPQTAYSAKLMDFSMIDVKTPRQLKALASLYF